MSAPKSSKSEHFVKVVKSKKRYHALKFHAGNDIEFKNNTKAELAREGLYQPRPEWESLPKTGTGSEFNRENREIARRKKFGFHSKGQSIDDLPWILTIKDPSGKEKQFRAKRSVSDNSSYFVFINNAEIGGFEAHPLEDWYTFTPYKTYKTLTIEEAEEEFSKRHKTLNMMTIMANKRKNDAEKEEGEPQEKPKKKGGLKSLDEIESGWIGSGDEDGFGGRGAKGGGENLSDDEDEVGGERSDDEKGKKPRGTKASRKNNDEEDEAKVNEESDDGDHEGDEVDYSSDDELDSDSDFEQTKNEEKYVEKGIDEEAGMKALENEEDEEDEDKELTEEGKEYKKLMTQKIKEDDEASKDSAKKSSEHSRGSAHSSDSSDIDDPDNDPSIVSTLLDNKKSFLNTTTGSTLNESTTTTSKSKRKATDDLKNESSSKRTNTNNDDNKSNAVKAALSKAAAATATPSTPSLLFEDEVRKYLQRKPMTIKELINKFKKKTTMSIQELTEHFGKILNKLKESKEFKVEEKSGTKYLSLI